MNRVISHVDFVAFILGLKEIQKGIFCILKFSNYLATLVIPSGIESIIFIFILITFFTLSEMTKFYN